MSDTPVYREVLGFLQAGSPKLVPFFARAVDRAAACGAADPAAVRALGQLAVVSDATYVDPDAFVALAAGRGELAAACSLLYDLSRAGPGFAAALLARYAGLRVPLSTYADDLRAVARACAAGGPAVARRGDAAIALGLGFDEPSDARSALSSLRDLAAAAPGALPELLPRFSSTLRTVPPSTFLSWLSRGAMLAGSSRVEEGVGFLRGRTRESRELLGVPSASLDELRRVLKIYASSLAGREVGVLGLDASSLGAAGPYTDGRTLFLPPEIRLFDAVEANEAVYTLLAAHQAAAIGMGTFGLDLAKTGVEQELHDRYVMNLPSIMAMVRRQYRATARAIRERAGGAIEVVLESGRTLLVMETEHERFFSRFPAPVLARELFGLVENARIRRALSRRYPGLAEDGAMLNGLLWKQRPLLRDPGDDADARLTLVLSCVVEHVLAGRWKQAPRDPDLSSRAAELTATLDDGVAAAASVEDSAALCLRLYVLLDSFSLIPWSDRHDARAFFAPASPQELRPEAVRDASPELMAAVEERRERAPGQGARVQDIDITTRTQRDVAAQQVRDKVAAGDLRVFRYPELDLDAGAVRPAWCTLFERRLESRRDDAYRALLAAHRTAYARTMKRFLALRPEGVELSRRWLSGDEIHLGDAVDYITELLRGAAPEETIYFRKVTNRRDIAAAVVLDASSSTAEEVGGRRIIDVEKAALAILASALSRIGDDFGLFSYFSLGRHQVFFEVVKDFHEPWEAAAQGRIGSIRPQASNRDGCAIRHAAARLAELPHATKLLLLLSDGVPADVGYGGATSAETSPYAIEDTRRAVLDCRRMGIVPFCITIDREARDYAAHLWGDFHFTVIDDVEQLPERLSRLYLRFTG